MTPRKWIMVLAAVAIVSLMGNAYFMTRSAPPVTDREEPLRLPRGTQLEGLRGRSELGDIVDVRLAGVDRPTLLYVVTPSCIWCKRNRDNFLELIEHHSGEYTIVLASLADAGFRTYVETQRPLWGDARVITMTGLSRATRSAMMLGSTPQTLVIGRNGKVLQNWVGAYTRNTLVAVENFFLVQMPGLVADQPSAQR